jgi:hypothetical protein
MKMSLDQSALRQNDVRRNDIIRRNNIRRNDVRQNDIVPYNYVWLLTYLSKKLNVSQVRGYFFLSGL